MSAVAPASCMWFPLIEIGLNFGISVAQYRKMSPTIRIDGAGG